MRNYFIPSTNVEASSYLSEGRSIGRVELEESNGNLEHLNGELEIELAGTNKRSAKWSLMMKSQNTQI